MDSQNSDKPKKPRSYYVDYTKGNNKFRDRRRETGGGGPSRNSRYRDAPDISFGHRGFLVTSIDEVKSYLEMRNIFEEYYEQLYKSNDESKTNKDQTTDDALEEELKRLRKDRPFKQVKTYCRNSLFINITKEFSHVEPVKIVDRFFDDLAEKREIKSSNTFKVLPVLDTFRNSVACAKESVARLLEGDFKDDTGPFKYFIEFQSRGNYKLNPEDKQNMIEGVANTVTEFRPEWKVDREGADYIIVLVSLKNVCCISFLKNYFKRSKYNVIEFCKEFAPTEQPAEIEAQSKTEGIEVIS